ncbi:MAG: DUF3575 domain-containing protein [Bacteroidaceae bacterium]|nr:DUF3575 domain-containing protein [Bacteroidaceae bacterium]
MRYLLSILLLVVSVFVQRIAAQTHVDVDSVKICRSRDSVQVRMQIDLKNINIDRKELLWLTPRLINGNDSIDYPSVCLYGRNNYYSYVRTGPYANYADMQIRGKRRPITKNYIQNIPFQAWMDSAKLVIVCAQTNSCGTIISEKRKLAYEPTVLPLPPMERPAKTVEPIIHSRSGVSHVDFILDSIVIHPEYHDNYKELAKIRATIDSVVNDTNANPKLLTIHGYASPEGPYKHNVWLARERTKALAEYIKGIYNFPAGFVRTNYTPEDWEGFIRFIEQSTLPHRQEILDISRSDREPDAKMLLIKRRYPAEYKIMLEKYLPYLRHSDYRIDYTLKDEMKRLEEAARPAYVAPTLPQEDLLPAAPLEQFKQFKPILAIKTNLLFDAALCPNIEVEVPFGYERKYSAMVEYWTPWYVWKHNTRSYEFQMLGLELRRWFRTCRGGLPPLSGPFVGLYYANGKYDLQWDGKGNQGEFNSVGLSAGYSWVLNKHLNLEASFSAGCFWGPYRHYTAEFDNSRLIWQYTARTTKFIPTKLKLSLVWLVGPTKRISYPQLKELRSTFQKGGDHE